MTSVIQYTVKDFDDIIFQGINCTLSSSVIEIIQSLNKTLMQTQAPVTNHHKYPDKKKIVSHFKPKHEIYENNKNGENKLEQNPELDNWKKPESTNDKEIPKPFEKNIKNTIQQIRIAMNKLSPKNYTDQCNTILEHIKTCFDNDNTIDESDKKENITKITEIIFNIASSNKFYSEIYADLYCDLIKSYNIFSDLIMDSINQFKQTVDDMRYVDPKTNDDDSTRYLKKNDLRRASCVFLIHLMKKGVISDNTVIEIVQYFLERLNQFMKSLNRTNEVEELSENLFLLVINGKTILAKHEIWKEQIFEPICEISKLKAKDFPSLTNRTIFKFQEMIEKI
jgi:hypothetical protein